MNYQSLILVGNATGDAQRRQSRDGEVSYTTFRVGVSDSKGRATYFPVTVFGRYGESVAEHITKGRQLLVEGRIEVGESDRFNVVAERVVFGTQGKAPAPTPEE
jgi:single-stranded DNA-binding protein